MWRIFSRQQNVAMAAALLRAKRKKKEKLLGKEISGTPKSGKGELIEMETWREREGGSYMRLEMKETVTWE